MPPSMTAAAPAVEAPAPRDPPESVIGSSGNDLAISAYARTYNSPMSIRACSSAR
ncbi:Uncharacterised protein [Mycobacteroides abscessus subsp. abscessus]|nr:Uncharacterised protein [Mycobacteroides abscessus subsp. abscessus]